MHMPVTVCFPDYALNENIHMYCFHEWDVFLIHLFYERQKQTFAYVIFSKICYVACTISCTGQLI